MHYENSLVKKLFIVQVMALKKDFLITHFDIREKPDFHDKRKTNEAVHIRLNAPALNKQVLSKNYCLCPCPTSKPDEALSGKTLEPHLAFFRAQIFENP